MSTGTHIFKAADRGDPQAAAALLPLVYTELRRLAGIHLSRETPGQTLDATALVHEACLRLMGTRDGRQCQGQMHFVAAAAESMRRIPINRARAKAPHKPGGGRRRVPLDQAHRIKVSPEGPLVLNDALDRLTAEEPHKAELVKSRFFGGLSTPQASNTLGISHATAERRWGHARSWLLVALAESENDNPHLH